MNIAQKFIAPQLLMGQEPSHYFMSFEFQHGFPENGMEIVSYVFCDIDNRHVFHTK